MSTFTVTRREVLGAGLGLAATALAIGTLGLGALVRLVRPSHLVEASYRPLMGDAFAVGAQSVKSELKLARIRGLGPLRYGNRLLTGSENFALEFTGEPGLPSGLQTMWHPMLGQFQLFINPVGRPGSPQRYEAIVNTYDLNVRRRIDV